MLKYHWSLPARAPEGPSQAGGQPEISPLLAQCLFNRGLSESETISQFLEPRLKDLTDPLALPGLSAAVERLLAARHRGEWVVIFGDYDVDGVSATALLLETLGELGWKVKYYLPRRFDEGYGLTREAAENCLQRFKPDLLVAVDCGSTAVSTIAWARQQGVEVIVLDHHQVSKPLPEAVALVNPRLATGQGNGPGGRQAGTQELCSAGLAFKLAHALVKRMRQESVEAALKMDLRNSLDLVALGTVADLVPITGENRIMVAAGLKRLESTRRAGLVALKEVAQCPSPIGCYETSFQLAPRLNAAGRMEDAEEALRLLLAPDLQQAEALARSLDGRNRLRQQIEREITEEVIAVVGARFDAANDFVVVEGRLSWHIGVVGIVAARVLRRFYRPAIILGGEGEVWRGSGRSIEGFDLAAALRDCADLLLSHGGHAMAAGLSLRHGALDRLRKRLNELARAALTPGQLLPCLKLDAAVRLADLTLEQVQQLERLAPCGPGNPAVQLLVGGLSHQEPPQPMGKELQHAKFRVTDGEQILEAVWWNCGQAPLPRGRFDLAVTPLVNEYKGRRKVQLKILDWRAAD